MPRSHLPSRLTTAWPVGVPVLAVLVLALTWGRHLGLLPVVLVAVVLAVAVTVIEVALIVTLMVSGGSKAESLAGTPCSRR